MAPDQHSTADADGIYVLKIPYSNERELIDDLEEFAVARSSSFDHFFAAPTASKHLQAATRGETLPAAAPTAWARWAVGLHDRRVAVAIDDEAREPVALAVDEAVAGGAAVGEEGRAQAYGAGEAGAHPGVVDHVARVGRQDANREGTLWIPVSLRDDGADLAAIARADTDDVSSVYIRRTSADAQGVAEEPRVAAFQLASEVAREDDLGQRARVAHAQEAGWGRRGGHAY